MGKIFKSHYLKNLASVVVFSDFRDTNEKIPLSLFNALTPFQTPINLLTTREKVFKDITLKNNYTLRQYQ